MNTLILISSRKLTMKLFSRYLLVTFFIFGLSLGSIYKLKNVTEKSKY